MAEKEKVKLYVTIGLLAFLLSFGGTIAANAFYGGRYAEKVDHTEKEVNIMKQDFDAHKIYDNQTFLKKEQFDEYKEARLNFQIRVLDDLKWIRARLK